MKKTATIILNRNLPKVTDKLIKKINRYNKNYTDIFLVDSGSNKKLISKYTTWVFNSKKVKKFGLRFSRGMNYGLSQLYKENKFNNYDFFFLVTNDTVVENKPFINKLQNILYKNKSIGMLSPCSKKWGEYYLLKKNRLKFFWYIHNNAYFLKREFVEDIMNLKNPGYMNFLFDGNNFRGYGVEIEIIAKGYKKNWASAITSDVTMEEDEKYLLNKNQLIKTDPFEKNIKLYLEEGKKWMKDKYGFSSKWAMQMYVKKFYELFFKKNPDLIKFKL